LTLICNTFKSKDHRVFKGFDQNQTKNEYESCNIIHNVVSKIFFKEIIIFDLIKIFTFGLYSN